MASPTFRSSSNNTGTTNTLTVTEPAGAASGDIFIATSYQESITTSFGIPTGWSDDFGSGAVDTGIMNSPHNWEAHAYWIRRGGSAPDLTFTFGDTAYSEVRVVAYSGAVASGTPFSFATTAVRNSAAANNPFPDISGTTDTADELLVWIGTNWVGSAGWTPPTSPGTWTDRGTNGTDIYVSGQAQAVAGATGTVTGAQAGGGTNSNASTFLFGLRSVAAGSTPDEPLPPLWSYRSSILRR